jgi:transcriptional regulator with PAS, ATPase and Fis domain
MKRSESALDLGVVVIDPEGNPALGHGLGRDPEIVEAVRRQLDNEPLEPAGAFSLKASGDWLVIWRSDPAGTVCLIQRADDEGWLGVAGTHLAAPPDRSMPWRGRVARKDVVRGLALGEGGDDDGTLNLDHIVGTSEAIIQLKSDIAKVAPLDVPVLIVGESGTGKELAAKAIHAMSARSDKTMVFVNAAALPSGLVESELFGYEAGAFTGAERAGRKGKFELADKGSLFFDEVGDMPLEIQVKLLRVLQDGVYERVGGHRSYRSDFRLISATNRNFQDMIGAGDFRLDLFYRISGVTIRMPSLRERLSDLPLLVRGFLDAFAARHRTQPKGVAKGVIEFLSQNPWPGNIRQLLHEVEKAAIFCEGPDVTIDDFRFLGAVAPRAEPTVTPAPMPVPSGGMRDAVANLEKSMIHEAMKKHRGNKKKVAEELGISRAYLYKILGESQGGQ